MAAECAPRTNQRGTRPDVAARRAANKHTKETCVKACLQKLLRGDAEEKSRIVEAVDNRVAAYSRHIHLLGVKFSTLLKEHFYNISDDDLPTTKPPFNMFDPNGSCYRQLMLSTFTDASVRYIKEYVEAKRGDVADPLHPYIVAGEQIPRWSYDTNIYVYGSKQYVTVLSNSIWMNFDGRVGRFLKTVVADKNTSVVLRYKINGWTVPPSRAEAYQDNVQHTALVARHRAILGLADGEKIDQRWLKSNLWSILKYYVFLNREYCRIGHPEFGIVPCYSIKRHFICIDTNVVYGIFKEAGLVNCSKDAFGRVATDHWHSVFDIHSLQGQHNVFTGTIQSDGVAAIVHYRRPKNGCDGGATTLPSQYERVVAFDPGRANILYGVERITTESGEEVTKEYRFTREHYYMKSGMIKARERTKTWHQGETIAQALKTESTVSIKGVDMRKHTLYLKAHQDTFPMIFEEHMKRRWAAQRLRLYGGKKRAFAEFFNRISNAIDKTKNIVVAYGAAKFAPGGKGEVSVPTTRAFKECSYRFPTVAVDEFRTTKVSVEDDSVLQQVQLKRCKGSSTVVRGLLWSTTTNKFVNRDRNAALNILRVSMALPNRPAILDRSKVTGALKQSVAKWIR